ncbi:M48 family metallopeptidase [Mesobacillus selenatarsenatis]|uniref:Ankyrin repeat protein, putative n=1 Tax=Mesobacillus selenatarsenatis (strain DSM 18680 / JCM 14380 / FERM P-15431 / SF-1) TaxID=1321606 RepID=A0A0A8X0I3_MESS1|nr:ankyrin repeat domain-containing protein [Mesobacillus selenatarsenatis]GAM13485.1 ankyrin repeat protein, putative [Mesobacillus selenatarsenatis SF-1]
MTGETFNEKNLIHKNENKYFWIVLSISIASYILFALSIVGIFIIAGFLFISLLLHALMIGQIRLNAVKISGNQFPLIHSTVEDLCVKMGIKRTPDIYVMQSGGIMNAFATRFFGRNMIVVYSEIFDLIEQNAEDELQFVLAHELAHIKRNHLSKMMFILPSMWIPGIAEMYLRACEYTCDRYAAFYTGNPAAAKNGLTMLAIGKVLFRSVNKAEYLEQINQEKGFVVWLAEILSTHPPLPKRINEISAFFGETDSVIIHSKKSKGLFAFLAASVLLTGFGVVGGVMVFKDVSTAFFVEEEYYEEDTEISTLIDAVISGNTKKVDSLIENGEDIHQIDYNGYTALDWAVMDDNIQMVQLLLDLKADPNFESDYGMTPFMTASEKGTASMIKMLHDAGGDPNYQEMSSGYTALTYAVFSGEIETVKLLIELGADIQLKDYSGMTARMHALQSGEQEIADLLK